MPESNATPTRKLGRIEVAICCECFCSIPADQKVSHAKWHQDQVEAEATAVGMIPA